MKNLTQFVFSLFMMTGLLGSSVYGDMQNHDTCDLGVLGQITSLDEEETLILVEPSAGDSFVVSPDPEAPFSIVFDEINDYLKDVYVNDFGGSLLSLSMAKGKQQTTTRNYNTPLKSADKDIIRYIVTSLAKYNWARLAKEASSLKKAGDKIDNLHPYRFLEATFTDDELISAIYVVRNRSLVWSDYYNGLKDSMNEEADLNNLNQFTADFANRLQVDVNKITPLIQSRQWADLVDTLIADIPRKNKADRYGN